MKILFLSFFLVASFCGAASATPSNSEQKVELKWTIDHVPAKYFEIAAKVMSENLAATVGDKISVNVNSVSNNSRADRHQVRKNLLESLREQKIGIAQVYLDDLGYNDKVLRVFGLPYLFRDHDHVTKVINGPIGRKMMNRLATQGLKGLAFTYSGGYQGFLSRTKLDLLSSNAFKGLVGGAIYDPTIQALGSTSPDSKGSDLLSQYSTHELVGNGNMDFCLVTFADIDGYFKDYRGTKPLYYYGADFNVLLTIITMNNDFYNSLTPEYQQAIVKAAVAAASAERGAIISDGKISKEQIEAGLLTNQNLAYVKMNEKEISALKKLGMKAYDLLDKEQMALVKAIRNTK